MEVLVLGGTRFFGKRLVEKLIAEGEKVTIGTRGRTGDSFGNKVQRIQLDRTDRVSMKEAVRLKSWDVVYDQICYSPNAAIDACEVFAGKTGKYIFTSSMSVYDLSPEPISELNFNPYKYPIEKGNREDFSYGEGKRLAEAVFYQQALFPVIAVRFPIVMGTDDYTERLLFHIDRIKKGQPIGIPNKEAKLSFVSSQEAADFLAWVRKTPLDCPVNACASGDISLGALLKLIEKTTDKRAIVQKEAGNRNQSPYGIPDSWVMDNEKAKTAGFSFSSLDDWLPDLIEELAKE